MAILRRNAIAENSTIQQFNNSSNALLGEILKLSS
jgi:hypothetical protein